MQAKKNSDRAVARLSKSQLREVKRLEKSSGLTRSDLVRLGLSKLAKELKTTGTIQIEAVA